MTNELVLEYFVPFEQSAEIGGDFTINGIAINETTTSNGHVFLGEELKKAAGSLRGVPLLKDHNNFVDSIVGKVKESTFDDTLRNISFSAVVKDQKMQQLIRDGLLQTVSVGAHVDPKNIEELENGDIVPRGIIFKELSLVAVPADDGATFTIALNNAYQKHKQSLSNLQEIERGSNMTNISEEKVPKTEEVETVKESVKEVEESIKEESIDESINEKIIALIAKVEKKLTELADVDEKPKEEESEPEAEAEEEEETEEAVEEKDYNIVEGHRSFSFVRKSYNY